MARAADGAGRDAVRPLLSRDRAVLTPRVRGLFLLVFLLAAVQTLRHDEAFLLLGVMASGALALAVPVLEWRMGTDRLMASLPVGRATHVRARYIVAGLALVVAWAAWLATGHLLAPVLAPDRPGPDSWATLPGSLTFVALGVVLLTTFLPMYFRLGLGRAATALIPVVVALYLGALGISAATGTIAGSGGFRWSGPGTVVRSAIEGLIGGVGAPSALATLAIGLGALGVVSFWLSVRGFRRRDL